MSWYQKGGSLRQISLINFKGGVGKSTLAINLGDELARRGVSVLIIDCDLQGNASTILPTVKEPTLTHVLKGQAPLSRAVQQAREKLYVVPADANLNKAANYIIGEGRRGYYTLRDEVRKLEGIDLVFFDHSPNYTAVTESALLASNQMLIPCELAPFAVEGLLQMFTKLEETLVDHSLDLVGIVPFKLNRSKSMHLAYLKDLQETFKGKIYPSIRTDTMIEHAQSKHIPVYEHDQHSKAVEDFSALADLLMKEGVSV